jgi:hypothetical protein
VSGRDWDKELAKIDRQIGRMSDDELTRAAPPASPAGPASRGPAPAAGARGGAGIAIDSGRPVSRAGVYFRVGLAIALAVSVPFWPYAARCGVGLAGYLASVGVVIAAGTWAALSTWRARFGRAHVAAIVVAAWGLALAAGEVLPRIGYAKDQATWVCR